MVLLVRSKGQGSAETHAEPLPKDAHKTKQIRNDTEVVLSIYGGRWRPDGGIGSYAPHPLNIATENIFIVLQ